MVAAEIRGLIRFHREGWETCKISVRDLSQDGKPRALAGEPWAAPALAVPV
jgi:hypothetical protein